jgi:hypothetical protein
MRQYTTDIPLLLDHYERNRAARYRLAADAAFALRQPRHAPCGRAALSRSRRKPLAQSPLWDDTLPGRHWITSPNLPTTPQPVAELSVPPHAASRAGSRICEADASPESASGHAPHPGASSPPRHFLMLATNSCAMTRNAGSPYDLPRTFVFGQCVIERYFFIHKARFLAASPRRPNVLGKLDQFFDGSSGPQPDMRIRPSRTWRPPSIRLTLASPASFRSSRP